MARQLVEQGDEIASLILLDSWAPSKNSVYDDANILHEFAKNILVMSISNLIKDLKPIRLTLNYVLLFNYVD